MNLGAFSAGLLLLVLACGGSTDTCPACGRYTRIDALIYGADTIDLRSDLTFRHSSQNLGVNTGPYTLNGSQFSFWDGRVTGNSIQIWDTGTLTGNTLHVDGNGVIPGRTFTRQ